MDSPHKRTVTRKMCPFFMTSLSCNPDTGNHDDVIKWKHFPRYWLFVRGIHRSPVNSLHKGQWRGALMFSLICVWINGCGNNREAGDLRRYRAHYDVIVMRNKIQQCSNSCNVTLNITFTFALRNYITLICHNHISTIAIIIDSNGDGPANNVINT